VQSADIPLYDPEQNNNDSRHNINRNPHSEVNSGRLHNVYMQLITAVTSLKLLQPMKVKVKVNVDLYSASS